MKTLVIHPVDPTTDFLSAVYEGKGWNVVRQHIGKGKLRKMVQEHDRIIMLGHGTQSGLMGKMGHFGHYFVVDSSFVQALREKEIVAIWCDADIFVERYGLKGFYTGMIVSEYEEAIIYSVPGTDDDIDESNQLFAKVLAKSIVASNMLTETKKGYVKDGNKIVEYNNKNLFCNI